MSAKKLAAGLDQRDKIIWFIVWTLLGLAALRLPLSYLLMAKNQSFTLFEFLAPVAGMIFGPWLGAAQVILTKLFFVVAHTHGLSYIDGLRLLPLAGAAFYFGLAKKYPAIIAAFAILVFVAHPVGRQVWFYSFYWLIPIAASFFKKNPIANALGATFTAHAMGGAMFIWALNTPVKVWLTLIPIVAAERAFFALGIALTSIIVSKALKLEWKQLARTVRRATI